MGLAQFLVTQTGIDVVNGKNDVKKVWKSPFFKMGQFFLKSAPNLLLISRISARNSKMATFSIYLKRIKFSYRFILVGSILVVLILVT